MTASARSPTRSIQMMLMAVTCLTLMQAFVKAADRIPAGEMVFFRSVVSIPMILIWLAAIGQVREGTRVASWKSHVVRGLAGTCAMGLGFAGVRLLPLPEATAIRFITPVLIVVLAALILGERFRKVRFAAVLMGLAGVVVISYPNFTGGEEGAILGVCLILGSAALAALAQVFVKRMSATDDARAIVFWFALTASGIALLTLPFGWRVPQGIEWVWLFGAGIIGGVGQLLLTASYRDADAGVLAPFSYVSMLWAVLIGWLWFKQIPTWFTWAGSSLIIAAGVMIVLRERALGKGLASEGKVRAKKFL